VSFNFVQGELENLSKQQEPPKFNIWKKVYVVYVFVCMIVRERKKKKRERERAREREKERECVCVCYDLQGSV